VQPFVFLPDRLLVGRHAQIPTRGSKSLEILEKNTTAVLSRAKYAKSTLRKNLELSWSKETCANPTSSEKSCSLTLHIAKDSTKPLVTVAVVSRFLDYEYLYSKQSRYFFSSTSNVKISLAIRVGRSS
jgi:hypothetical protein